MFVSRYNVVIENFPVVGRGLIYNTLHHSYTLVNGKILDWLTRGDVVSLDPPAFDIPLERFFQAGILVPDGGDEEALLREHFEKIKESPTVLNAIIMTTYACNLACGFCIENGVKHPVYMNDDTTRQVIDWLSSRIMANRPRTLSLAFYGGEPTLHLTPIKSICRHMQTLCREWNIDLDVGLTTNGTLLNGAMVDELRDYGLVWAVIAMASAKNTHDRMRPYGNGIGSFDTIIHNLHEIAGKIKVIIKGIYDDENEDSLIALLDHLKGSGLGEAVHNIGFDPVIANISGVANPAYSCGVHCYSHSNLETNLRLIKEALLRNLRVNLDFSMGPCSTIMNRNYITVDPAGMLYKCPAFAGHEEFIVGHIRDGVDGRFEYFRESHPWEACRECQFVPLCGGGCRYSAYLKNRDCESIACERRYFEEVGLDLIEMTALQRLFHGALEGAAIK